MTESDVEKRLMRLEAVHQVENIIGIYEYLHSAGMYKEKVDRIFSHKSSTVCAEVGGWGHFVGIESVRRCYEKLHPWSIGSGRPDRFKIGTMYEHDITTGVIEVAGDLKTAKGVWMSPGHETKVDPETGRPRPAWCWVKYACDFINENGVWKLWHCFIFLTFFTYFEESWADSGEHPSETKRVIPDELKAELSGDRPSVMRHNPFAPNYTAQLLPAYPEPYEKYDGLGWMDPENPVIQGMYKEVDV